MGEFQWVNALAAAEKRLSLVLIAREQENDLRDFSPKNARNAPGREGALVLSVAAPASFKLRHNQTGYEPRRIPAPVGRQSGAHRVPGKNWVPMKRSAPMPQPRPAGRRHVSGRPGLPAKVRIDPPARGSSRATSPVSAGTPPASSIAAPSLIRIRVQNPVPASRRRWLGRRQFGRRNAEPPGNTFRLSTVVSRILRHQGRRSPAFMADRIS
jgi:hypothetical protein